MKRTAFIQALIIFLLLVGSWTLLVLRLTSDEQGADGNEKDTPGQTVVPAEEEMPVRPAPEPATPMARPAPDAGEIPEGWKAWIAYLQESDSPGSMRTALSELRTSIFSLPKDEAVSVITEFLRSGFDLRTGLGFDVAPDGALEGAASLRAILLDWLAGLDPLLAAERAKEELNAFGTGLSPDEYAVHLRNYTLGSEDATDERSRFLERKLEQLLQHDPWIREPTSAVVQAFDVAVYTGATRFAPEFEGLMSRANAQLVRRASAMALERLVDTKPVQTLETMLEGTKQPVDLYKARAGYFARLDPGLEDAPEILDAYLSAPGVSPDEIRFFIRSFPNLNRTFSYSLLGTQNSSTGNAGSIDRLRNALEQVRQWQAGPRMQPYADVLEAQRGYLEEQLGEMPGP